MSAAEYFYNLKKDTSIKGVVVVSAISVLYLVLCRIFIGYKSDQLVLVALINTLFYLSVSTRKFLFGFSIFIVFWVIFDSMKIYPNYKVNTIHLEDLYQTEKSLFGITDNGVLYTPNEYLRSRTSTFVDVAAGLFYLMWVPVPLIFAAWLFKRNKNQFLSFSLSFLQQYGFDLHFNTPGNTAGLAGFDHFFGVNVFHALYSKSSNVFAAMPSLHSAYPLVVLYFGLKNRLGLINIFFALVAVGIWSAAVYTSHHYILDVLAGILCAAIGISIFEFVFLKIEGFKKLIAKYEDAIS